MQQKNITSIATAVWIEQSWSHVSSFLHTFVLKIIGEFVISNDSNGHKFLVQGLDESEVVKIQWILSQKWCMSVTFEGP